MQTDNRIAAKEKESVLQFCYLGLDCGGFRASESARCAFRTRHGLSPHMHRPRPDEPFGVVFVRLRLLAVTILEVSSWQ